MKKKTYSFILIVLFVLLAWAGLSPGTSFAQDPLSKEATTPTSNLKSYVIQVGDEFEIKSYYNPELNEKVVVRPDGRISLPLVGEINVAGKTPEQLATLLTERYSSEFKQPDVSVILRSFGAQKVFVAGQVNRPGMFDLTGHLTVLGSISLAEGFTEGARVSEVVLIRRGEDGRPIAMILDLKRVINASDLSQDVMMRPFDIVYVPMSRIASVNKFVDQYLRKNIPVPFVLGYRLDTQP